MTTTTGESTEFVFSFGGGEADGGAHMVEVLGGKGSNLHEMTRLGVPVPPGFTISTEACRRYYSEDGRLPGGLMDEVRDALARVEDLTGRNFGDPERPLLFSVRSGAPVSMPGMMDTVLNLGLNDETVEGLARETGNPRFARDSHRRLIQMYGDVVAGVEGEKFEELLDRKKRECGGTRDTDLGAGALGELVGEFRRLYEDETGEAFPSDPMEQLTGAISAVFGSWSGERAVKWREIQGLPHDVGTAANVQAMVFGNRGEGSASGVAFTRDPATGAREPVGEYLPNAQGEDVVSGVRTPRPLNAYVRDREGSSFPTLEEEMPERYGELVDVMETLEEHYRDMQDLEFTVEEGELYILQTRTGKRTAAAMVKIAHDMAEEGLITRDKALDRLDPGRLDQLLHPTLTPAAREEHEPVARGLGASPGGAVGRAVFDSDTAEAWADEGQDVVLVRRETSPEDIGGMHAAEGILTSRGGGTSHAAVVARGMGTPCVAGCEDVDVFPDRRSFRAADVEVSQGDWITLDGATGEVFLGRLEMQEPEPSAEFATVMEWADDRRRLGIRTNADTPEDARRARQFGAEGIGLCRTEHMFFQEERIRTVREMILLAPEIRRLRVQKERLEEERATARPERRERIGRRLREVEEELERALPGYEDALERLLPVQREDFEEIFEAMEGAPVTIRLLDPPLHEFLPRRRGEIRQLAAGMDRSVDEVARLVEGLTEQNPMLGHRGCRLGLTYPEIYEMQARAIMEAAAAVAARGGGVQPEIMIPLVGIGAELARLRERVERVLDEVRAETGSDLDCHVGTMIELPRAALRAGEIAESADFFSFGTNDLTQTTYGISRDDAGGFLDAYRDEGLVEDDPFAVLDREGVGELIRIAVERGRETRADLQVGICGEHGGEPSSVIFCHEVGLDYVSCSPFRVPVARIAAAQAAVDAAEDVSAY